jgi:hypothetical protein
MNRSGNVAFFDVGTRSRNDRRPTDYKVRHEPNRHRNKAVAHKFLHMRLAIAPFTLAA